MTFGNHLKIACVGLGLTMGVAFGADERPGSYTFMDYGSVIGTTLEADWPKGNTANKGLAIRLGPALGVTFDTDLLRYSVATDGGWIDQQKTDHTTAKGVRVPRAEGREWWATEAEPGWAHQGRFDDPREGKAGNLPAEWGRYRGFYRQGEEVVLNYTIGETEVHEHPKAVRLGADGLAFVRTVSLGSTDDQKAAYLLEGRTEGGATEESPTAVRVENGDRILLVRLLDSPAGVKLRVRDGRRVELEAEASPERRVFRVVFVELAKENFIALAREAARTLLADPLRDPLTLRQGGPAQWPEEIETEVDSAVEAAGGYVRDSLGIPFENPWNSWMRPAGIAFYPDGKRAAVSTWNGDVWVVSGFAEQMETVRWKRFAAGLYSPMGLAVVDGLVHVIEQGQLTRLHDLNGDGEADFYENFNNDGVLYPRSYSLCLEVDSEGNFYFFKNGNRAPSRVPDHGALIRISADGTKREVFATGIRGANTLGIGPGDVILGADQQGNWTPADRVDQYRQGGFYGYRPHGGSDIPVGEFEAPILWMPHGLNNSSGSLAYAGDERWGPLAGNWILGSYGRGTIFALLTEEIDGLLQGGLVKLPFTIASGPIRSAVNPLDGQFYVLGLRGWGTGVNQDGSLDRIRYTGDPVYLPVGLNVEPEGVRLRFSEPLDPSIAADTSLFEVERWQYVYSRAYGSSQVSFVDPRKRGRDSMVVESVTLSPDRRSLFLQIADLRPVMQMRIGYDVTFADGRRERSEIHQTVHRLNDGRLTAAPVPVSRSDKDEIETVLVEEPSEVKGLEAGRILLEANCRACHQVAGTPGVAPAFETSEWARSGKEPLIRILLHGKIGDRGVMMPFAWMDDEDLAAILSYIRTELHESEPVSPEDVARVRKATAGRTDFWTVGELEELVQ